MNLHISRNGQTFGPYTIEQAKEFLDSGQLLPNDYALLEGSAEWKSLSEVLTGETNILNNPISESEDNPNTLRERTLVEDQLGPIDDKPAKKAEKQTKKREPNIQKASKSKGGRIIVVAQEKSLISKIFSTIFVFVFLFFLAIGAIVGLYFAMPSKIGPVLVKFGIELEGNPSEDTAAFSQVETKSPDEIMLSEDAWNTLRSSGIKILQLVGEKGVQVISSVDPELAMEDEDLEKLLIIAPHIVSLDLTDSKVTNGGVDYISKMPNLKKLLLEGVEGINEDFIPKLKTLSKLEHLNLIRVKLGASAVDALISLKSLREIYLFESGLEDAQISKLKSARPEVFVNSG